MTYVLGIMIATLAAKLVQSPSAQDVLVDALTIEGLLLAAYALSYGLTQPSTRGRNAFFAQAWFGWTVVLAIASVGVAAGAGWWLAFHPTTLHGTVAWLQAGGLFVGVVAPVVFAVAINWQAR
jgi:hypothetical protein